MKFSEFARIADHESRRARKYAKTAEEANNILSVRFGPALKDMVKSNRENGLDDTNIFWIMDLVGICGSNLTGFQIK